MKKKRVLFISGILGKGGAERITLYLINAFLECGVDVALVVKKLNGSYMPLVSSKCKIYKLSGSFKLFGLERAVHLISFIFIEPVLSNSKTLYFRAFIDFLFS